MPKPMPMPPAQLPFPLSLCAALPAATKWNVSSSNARCGAGLQSALCERERGRKECQTDWTAETALAETRWSGREWQGTSLTADWRKQSQNNLNDLAKITLPSSRHRHRHPPVTLSSFLMPKAAACCSPSPLLYSPASSALRANCKSQIQRMPAHSLALIMKRNQLTALPQPPAWLADWLARWLAGCLWPRLTDWLAGR